MTHREGCKEWREGIMAVVVGEVDETLADEVRRHVDTCAACREWRDSLAEEERMLRAAFDTVATETEPIRKRLVSSLSGRIPRAPQPHGGASREGDDSMISRDSTQPAVRPDAHVPTELADGVSRETHPIEQPSTWRHVPRRFVTMFQSKKARWAVPAAAAAAVVLGIGLWPGKDGRHGIVLADVLQHMSSAHTITCKASFYREGQLTGTVEYMAKDGHLLRIATSEGHVYIQNTSEKGTLVLNAQKRTATTLESIPDGFDLYKTIKDFRSGTERDIGTKMIEGREAIGFSCQSLVSEGTVWVDRKTHTPMQICEETIDRDSKKVQIVTRNFVFDVPLDDALFSMELPAGYVWGEVESKSVNRARQLALYVRSASAGNRILKACIRFANEHDGEWPPDLQSLSTYGVDAAALVNPRRPELAVGWTYVRPSIRLNRMTNPEKRILLYEVFEDWNEGINVGFADGRVEFNKDQPKFKDLLAH